MKITKIPQVELPKLDKRIKVVAYARVSTSSDEQLLSLETQKQHYEKYIKNNAEWKYVGLYFDKGVTGTKTDIRDGLMSLVADCERGLVDLIVTKSISRFCRNTADCLEIVRKLIQKKVYIYFEKEKLHTGSMESEMILSIMSSLAEEESISISENEKWSIKKRFEQGTYIISYPPYGYMNDKGKMKIVPDESIIVKEMFEKCLAGKSTHAIAVSLNKRGIKSKRDTKWTAGTINGIFKNEKYTGDVIFQKTYTDDNYNRHINYGEQDQYLCKNHHEAIISHEVFDKANEMIKQRAKEKGNVGDTKKYQKRYSFSGKIKCSECGSSLKRRTHYTPSGSYIAWCCSKHIEDKNACSMKYITDEGVKIAFATLLNKLRFANDVILKPLLIAVHESKEDELKEMLKEIDGQIVDIKEQKRTTGGLLSRGYIEKSMFIKVNNEMETELERLNTKKEFLLKMNESSYQVAIDIKELIAYLKSTEMTSAFEDVIFERYVDSLTVLSRETIQFEFKFGLKLMERV